ncbi:MAG: hypothetical protein IKA42_00095 [Clostridia bacterium]|nr:hypothetical protein [Clostridia bacterium]
MYQILNSNFTCGGQSSKGVHLISKKQNGCLGWQGGLQGVCDGGFLLLQWVG